MIAVFVIIGGSVIWWLQRPADAEPAQWQLDPAAQLVPSSDEIPILVVEIECASGKSSDGRIVVSTEETQDSITIDVRVRRRSGAQDCQGNPVTSYVIELDSPLGEQRSSARLLTIAGRADCLRTWLTRRER